MPILNVVEDTQTIPAPPSVGPASARQSIAPGGDAEARLAPVSSVRRLCETTAALSGVRQLEPRPWWGRFGTWLNRPRRVLLTLGAVWVLAVFDLGFTLMEAGTADFVELNPIAAGLLSGPPNMVMAFKFSLLTLGTFILLMVRRHFVAELGCWFLLATKTYVALRWLSYYSCLVGGYSDPLIEAPLDPGFP